MDSLEHWNIVLFFWVNAGSKWAAADIVIEHR